MRELISGSRGWPPSFSLAEVLSTALAFLVLSVCIFYSYLRYLHPYPGFDIDPATWQVYVGPETCAEEPCVLKGDQILEIDGLSHEEYKLDRTAPLFANGRSARIKVSRNEEELDLLFEAPPPDLVHRLHRIFSSLIPLIFWLVGTIAVLFVRPRDDRWLLLVFFQYNTSILVASGGMSVWQWGYAAVVFHAVVWFFLPLALHLHLVLPEPLGKRWHRVILVPAYATAVMLALVDYHTPLQRDIYLPWVAFGMVLSLGLVLLRLFRPSLPTVRIANRLMAFGVGVGLGPWLAFVLLLNHIDPDTLPFDFSSFLALAVALVTAPMWPMSYLYTLYKQRQGSIELRPNRLLGTYSFIALYITTYVGVIFGLGSLWHNLIEHPLLATLVVSSLFVGLGPFLHPRFQRLVDREVFGIQYSQEQVAMTFAAKIPTAFDRETLKQVITEEILPTFQIRQSALYLLLGSSASPLYLQGVPEHSEPDPRRLSLYRQHAGRCQTLPHGAENRDGWIRLILELTIDDEPVGVWLLGRRDPDDFYSGSDIALLQNLANQLASVIRARHNLIEKRSLQRQLAHSQKMESLGRLSASVAHDFNNLLSAILGYGDLLMERAGGDVLAQKYLRGIIASGEKASALTRQLLAFSRQQNPGNRVVGLNSTIQEVEELIRKLLGEDIDLSFHLGPEAGNLRIDPQRLQQVLLNVASNAADAMPDGGRLTFETLSFECTENGARPVAKMPPGKYSLLRVQDTGCGIPSEVLQRVFEPFFTTKPEGKGTGLGLSIAHGIISERGGFMTAESELDVGTTFEIYLPALAEGEKVEVAAQTPARRQTNGTETVLLAEDEEGVRLVASEILQARGYQVLEARDGGEALELEALHDGPISLLLTDVMMPRMKGPELASRLLGLRPGIKVLYMSGYGEDVLGRGMKHSVQRDFLIQKPFMPNELARRVREVLDDEPVH